MKLVNPFTAPGRWFKANLHTHTTTSDGRASPAETVEMYRRAGYHVLALTDHHQTNDVRGMSRDGLLVISGMEYHPRCPASPVGHHLVALDVPHGFSFDRKDPPDANACIRAVRAAGGETILAHPHFCGHRYDQYAYLDGYIGVEVFNATTDRMAHGSSETDWSHLLDAGRMLPAVAVDDTHVPEDRCVAWTWLKLGSLTARSVMGALRTGRYYSSTGPTIHDFRVRRGVVELRCSPAQRVYFIAQGHRGVRRIAEPGTFIRGFRRHRGPEWAYVRAVVVDASGLRAWTNPIVLPRPAARRGG